MSSQTRNALRIGLQIVSGLMLLLTINEVIRHFFDLFVNHGPLHDREPYWAELLLYALFVVLGGGAALLFAFGLDGVKRLAPPDSGGGGSSVTGQLLLASAVAVLGASAIGYFVTDFSWFTDDEQAYIYQSKLYGRGALSAPALEPVVAFRHPFVVLVNPKGGVPHWTGVYPVLQPALMALSTKLGNIHLSQLCCVGLIVFHTGRLAGSLFGSPRVGVWAAWLCAFSPMLLGLGATYHTSILATALSVMAVRTLLALHDQWSLKMGGALGLVTGAIFLARPMEGTLCVLLFGGFNIAHWIRRWLRGERTPGRLVASTLPLVGYGLGGLVSLAIFMAVNKAHTGDPFRSAYNILEQVIGGFFGFGETMMWGRPHTPTLAVQQTIGALVRMNAWLFGWPASLALWFFALRSDYRTKPGLLLFGMSTVQLCAYMPLAFGSVHDFGSAYHVWHLPWIACISASVLERMRVRLEPRWLGAKWPTVQSTFMGMTLAGLIGFWPLQVARWQVVSNTIQAPLRAAEAATKGQKALVIWTQYLPPVPLRTWVHYPPAVDPEDQIWWGFYTPDFLEEMLARYPERRIFAFSWEGDRAVVAPLDATLQAATR